MKVSSIFFKSLIFLCAFVPALLFGATELTLVQNGKANAVILLDNPATKSAQLGAFELQHHVKLITGVELPITNKKPTDGKVIIKIGGENKGIPYEGLRIRFSDNRILLTGNDTQDFRKVDYKRSGTFPSMFNISNGSLHAVYDFLEIHCGVRFYYMNEIGTTYKKRNTLIVKAKDRDFVPPLDAFRYIYIDDEKFMKLNPRDLFLWRHRWRMSQTYGLANHNQYSIYFAHWNKAKSPNLAPAFKGRKPELFAKGFGGKYHATDAILRNNYPNDADLPPQLCYSNPGTAKFYAEEANIYFNGKNTLGGWCNFYGKYPTDRTLMPRTAGKPWFYPVQGGDTGGYCRCPDCKKLFPEESEENYSNTKFHFIAEVAKELKKINPDAGISTLAYIRTLDYPEKVKLPDNVSVQLCLPVYSWWHPIARNMQEGAYTDWIKKEAKKRPLTLWTYLFSPRWDARLHHGDFLPFPGVYHHATGQMFKKFTADGVKGWFTEVELRYQALEAYIAAKICYDPSLDPEKIIDEYFKDMYGDAAPEMREFYDELERAYWNVKNCPPAWLKNPKKVMGPRGELRRHWTTSLHSPDINWQMGTPERMKKLSNLIASAQKKLTTPEEKARLEIVLKYLWRPAVQGRIDYDNFNVRKKTKPPTLDIVTIPDIGGDISKVDWKKATVIENWQTVLGVADPARCFLRLAADKKHLYMLFYDPAGHGKNPTSIWTDNWEIYFTTAGTHPMYQLTIPPKGDIYEKQRIRVEESEISRDWNSGVKVERSYVGTGWKVLVTMPLKNIPFNGKELRVNFFRTLPNKSLAWSPIFNRQYNQGAAYSGRLRFTPFDVEEKEFSYIRGNRSGIIKDSAARNGKTAWMNSDAGWGIRLLFNKNFPVGKYNVSVNVRTDIPKDSKSILVIGLHDNVKNRTTLRVNIPVSKISGKEFVKIPLGTWECSPKTLICVSAVRPACPGTKIFIDSFEFAPVEAPRGKDTTAIPVVVPRKESKVAPRNRNPYSNIDWKTVIRVPGTTHRHTHARTQAAIDFAAAQGIEFFTLSNYHPSVPVWPLAGGTKRDFMYRQRGYVYKGKYYDKEIDWNEEIAKWKHTLPEDVQKQLPLRAPEKELRLPAGVIEAPNAEFHAFKDVSYLVHVCAPGSVFSAGHFDLRNKFKLKENGYLPGCNLPWREAFKLMLERMIVPDGGGITINHPAWSYLRHDLTLEMLDFDPRVLGIEVYNHSSGVADHNAWSETHWDRVLATGRQCFGFFVPDHPGGDPVWHGRNIMLVKERTAEACLRAMRQGQWYGAINDRPLAFTRIELKDDVFTVETDKKALILLITAQGVVRRFNNTTKASIKIDPEFRKKHVFLRATATEYHAPVPYPQKLFIQPIMLLPEK